MSRFNFCNLYIDRLVRIERKPIEDSRGSFVRMFCVSDLQNIGWDKPISQINVTHTKTRGAIRGLHFQRTPYSEMKLVSCTRGEIWDVAVDLRSNSDTFLQWHAEVLSPKNGYSLLIPEGFAHGFQALTDDVEILYFHSEKYEPSSEGGLNFADPLLNIAWPIDLTEISPRDLAHPFLNSQFPGVIL